MTPAENKHLARRLSKFGYRFKGIKRTQKGRLTFVAATAESDTREMPPVSVAAITERAAVVGLKAAVGAIAKQHAADHGDPA